MGLMVSATHTKEDDGVEKFTVTDRLYLTADGRAVPGGDPEASELFATPGKRIPVAEAQRLGLLADEAREAVDSPAEDASTDRPETAVEPPAEKKPRTTKASAKAQSA